MALSILHLRRWIAIALALVCVVVAATFFIAKHKVENALKQVPNKLGVEIQQTANGFTISKSQQGRTIFKVQASKAIQLKQGHANLHDVTITIYGQDGSRFDQVYGKEFEYDQQSGDITGKGEVLIDLQSNPQGLSRPDQAAPKELKNPVHLKTTNLVFNQKTGDGWTPSLVEFSVPQASGMAVGAKYTADDGKLLLQSQVRMNVQGPKSSQIFADRALLEKDPREILLWSPKLESAEQQSSAEQATLFLRDDDTLDRATAEGNVLIRFAGSRQQDRTTSRPKSSAAAETQVSAQRLDAKVGERNQVETATLSGDVKLQSNGPQPTETTAGRALLTFGPENTLTKVHAEEQVRMLQHQASGPKGESKPAQDVQVTAPAIDYFIADGRRFTRAETFGPPEISFLPADGKQGPTHITADKFIASFDSLGQLSQVHGAPHARIVSAATPGTTPATRPPQPDRITSSDAVDAYFRPGTGVESAVQVGHFAYSSGTQRAFADRAKYTAADQILTLTGSPRLLDTGTETTADVVRLNRATGEGFAEGDVKTTYSDLKAQPNGGMLASSDPVHVTAQSMAAQNTPELATYTGNARLWQDANLIKAPWIQFRKDPRTVTAQSNGEKKVETFLVQADHSGKTTPVEATADHLLYTDADRKAHYEGGVVVHGQDMTVTANRMDVFLAAASSQPARAAGQAPANQATTPARLDRIIAEGSVILTQPSRRGTGDKLVYTASDDKFVLTGGPPSIFDAEQGKITGVSLTLYRTDDRVIVKGDSSSPAVTQTRVVR